MTVFESHNY